MDGARALAAAQGSYFVATGVWPLVHRRSFEAVTGPKVDFWLVQAVGALVAGVGAVLLRAAVHGRDRDTPLVGALPAAALGAVDVVFVARRRIRPVYLVDALLEAAFVVGWAARGDRR